MRLGSLFVCLVRLVCFVYLVDFVHLVCFVQPNERDKLNKPNKRNEPVWSLPSAPEERKGVGSLYFGTRYNSNLLTEGLP